MKLSAWARPGLIVAAVLSACALARAAEQNRLTPAELNDGWILLFDGETTFGWEATNRSPPAGRQE